MKSKSSNLIIEGLHIQKFKMSIIVLSISESLANFSSSTTSTASDSATAIWLACSRPRPIHNDPKLKIQLANCKKTKTSFAIKLIQQGQGDSAPRAK